MTELKKVLVAQLKDKPLPERVEVPCRDHIISLCLLLLHIFIENYFHEIRC